MQNFDFQNRLIKLNYFNYKVKQAVNDDLISQDEFSKISGYINQEENITLESIIFNDSSGLNKEYLKQQLFELKDNYIIDENTCNKFLDLWKLQEDKIIDEADKKSEEIKVSEKLEKEEQVISLEKEEVPAKKINLVDILFEKSLGKWFVFFGVILMVLSSFPVIREMDSNSLVYLILLLYSIGLYFSGYFTRKYFPWTGDVFYIVSLLVTPVILASAVSLNFTEKTDILIELITLVSVPLINYSVFKTLYKDIKFSYFAVFIILGLSSVFPVNIENTITGLGFLRSDFETFISLILFGILFTGSNILNKDIKITEGRHNIKAILLLNGLLIYVFLIVISANNVNTSTFGLIFMLISILFWKTGEKINNFLKINENTQYNQKNVKNLVFLGYIFSATSLLLSWSDPSKLVIVSFIGSVLYIFNQEMFQSKQYKIFNNLICGFLFNVFMLYLLILWDLKADIQSLLISTVTLLLITTGSIKNFLKWKNSLYFISILTSIAVWIKISIFDSWSNYTFISMFVLSFIYLLNALYHKRNVLSYISVVTFSIAYFSLISVVNPEMDFYNYRYYAVLLSFLYLSIGYLIQLRFSDGIKINLSKGNVSKAKIKLSKIFSEDIIKPYRFQDRFSSPYPYLISEPLYNIALLMTSFSLLVNLKDYTISILATIFYVLVFKIYPSRLWIYFALTSATSGFLGFFTNVLPEKYHNWGFIFISFNWFFVGTIVEEFFDAYDRKNPKLFHKETKYAQPFFQGALVVNIILLRYFFADLQNISSPEGWIKIQEEFFQLLLTSVLYVLKMRVYISKLWLYPCIIVFSLVLFFKAVSITGAEYNLIIMTMLSFFWLLVGNYFNNNQKVMKYIKNIVDHKIPELKTDSSYFKFHLYDFSSPFYTFAFLSASVSLFISAMLIPEYSLSFAANLEFVTNKLNILNLNFYIFQTINFILIAVFFSIYFPKKILLLDSSFEEILYPEKLKYLPLIAVTFCFLWIFSYLITIENVAIFLSASSLLWSVFYAIALKLKKNENIKVGNHYFILSIFLGTIALIISLVYLVLSRENVAIIPSLSLLVFSFITLFASTKISFLIYFIEISLLSLTASCFKSYYGSIDYLLLVCFFAYVNLILWIKAKKYSEKITERLSESTIFFSVLFPVLTILSNETMHSMKLYSILGSILYLTISLFTASKPYAFFSVLMFGIFAVLMSTSVDTFWFGLVGIIICYIFYAYYEGIIKSERFENFKGSLFPYVLIFPATVVIYRALAIPANIIDFYFIEFCLFILLSSILYAWVAYTVQDGRLKKILWWVTVILANMVEFTVLNHFEKLNAPLVFSSFGISLLLLANTQGTKDKEKYSYYYLGQLLLILTPLFNEQFVVNHKPYLFLLEFFAISGLLIYIGFRIKCKAFLYFNLFSICLLFSVGVLILFFTGNWIIRWSMLLFFGILITVAGTQLESKKEVIKGYVNSVSDYLKEWN